MQRRLKKAIVLSLSGLALTGILTFASIAGFLIAGAVISVLQSIGQAALPSARAANALLQPVHLKQDADSPRSLTTHDRRSIEHAVRMQIRAYAARDADRAFASLSPTTQQLYGRPDRFLRSIAQDLPTVLDTRRFAFLGLEQTESRIVQQVLITDGSGQEWLAEFQIEEHAKDDWRIKGCLVQATPGQQAQFSPGSSEALA
jgi:hypothetical protein